MVAPRVINQAAPTVSLGNFTATGTTLSVPITAATSANSSDIKTGDLVIVNVDYASTSATAPSATIGGVSMTLAGGAANNYATGRYQAVFYGFVPGNVSDPSNVVVTAPATISVMHAIARVLDHVDTTTPLDVSVVTSATSGTSHALGPILPVSNDVMLVACFTANNDNGAGATVFGTGTPSGWTIQERYGTSSGSDGSSAIYTQLLSSPASTSITVSTTASVGVGGTVLAIRGAADPIADVLVARAASFRGPNTTGGFTAGIPNPDTAARRVAPQTGDMVVGVIVNNDASATSGLALTNGSEWTERYNNGSLGTWIQVYTAPWSSSLTYPTVTTTQTIDRFWIYSFILRDVDPSDPVDDISVNISAGGSTTVTYGSLSIGRDDPIIVRLGHSFDDTAGYRPSSDGDDGSVRWIDPTYPTFSTVTGLDQGLSLLVGNPGTAAGGSTGTEAQTWTATVGGLTDVSIAFNRAPVIAYVVSAVTASVAASTNLEANAGAAPLVSAVTVAAGAETSPRSRRRQPLPRREILWVSDLEGNQVNTIT